MTPATGNPRKFHKGPPPFAGWWNAQCTLVPSNKMWGWFDGVGWSMFCEAESPAHLAAARAALKGAEYRPNYIV